MKSYPATRYRDRQHAWPAVLLIAVISFITYWLYRDHFVTGDPLIYADNILRLRFDDISIHCGYYLLGYLGHSIFGSMGLAIDQTLIILSNLTGAIGLVFAFLLVRELTRNRSLAYLSVVFLGASGIYLIYSTSAEVYVPQTAVLLLSMYCFVIRRPLISGLSFALALFISPLTVSVLPFYLYVWYWRRLPLQTITWAVIAFAAGFLPVFIPLHEEWLWGRRGLLAIGLNTPLLSVSTAVQTVVALIIKSFHWAAIFLPIGLIALFLRRKPLFVLVTITLTCQAYIIAKIGDVTILGAFFLQVYVFLALIIAEGVRWAGELLKAHAALRRGLTIALSLIFIISSLVLLAGPAGLLSPKITWDNTWRHGIDELGEQLTENGIVVTNFRYGVAYAFYSREDTDEELETTTGNRRWINFEYLTSPKFQVLLQEYEQIFIIETYSPSPGPQLFLSEEQLRARFNRHSAKSEIETLVPTATLTNYILTDDFKIYQLQAHLDTPADTGRTGDY